MKLDHEGPVFDALRGLYRANTLSDGGHQFSIVVSEIDRIKAINADLLVALERFANLDTSVNSDLWAINKTFCDQARAAIAKASNPQ